MHQLEQYIGNVDAKKTKTQETYQLLSGKLVHKFESIDYKRDEAQLIEWCKKSSHDDLVEVSEKLKWGELKKLINISGDDVVDAASGEIIPGITAYSKPGKFEIK